MASHLKKMLNGLNMLYVERKKNPDEQKGSIKINPLK